MCTVLPVDVACRDCWQWLHAMVYARMLLSSTNDSRPAQRYQLLSLQHAARRVEMHVQNDFYNWMKRQEINEKLTQRMYGHHTHVELHQYARFQQSINVVKISVTAQTRIPWLIWSGSYILQWYWDYRDMKLFKITDPVVSCHRW